MHHRMDHHHHGRNGHGRRDHEGHYEKCGRHGRVGRYYSPRKDRCMRRSEHHGFRKFDHISCHILNETEVRNIIGEISSSKDQIRQIVREFFKRGHEIGRKFPDIGLNDCTNEKYDETAAKEEAIRKEGEFNRCHFIGRHSRRRHHWAGWTYGPCNVEQGRNNEEKDFNKEVNEPEEECSTNHHYGWHHPHNSSQCWAMCKEKGRSSQEETSDNEEQEKMDFCCKWRHRRHREERFDGPGMHHFRGWERHSCCLIFVDSPSFTRIATEEAKKEVSQASAPATESMEDTEVYLQRVQEAEHQEAQEVAEHLKKSSLE